MRRGKKSLSQTPSPLKERIKGSKVNPKGSASSKSSASSIKLSDSIITTLEKKKDEYNKNHSKKVSLATLKAVFRRGSGAYSSSHRPTITGGVPNSRSAWAFARVNKFLLKKGGTKVKAAYVQDDDLMAKGGLILDEAYSGKDVKKYLEKANYQDDSFFQYIKNSDKYVLKNVNINSIVQRDSGLHTHINQSIDEVSPNENEWEWANKFPIVIGDNEYDKNIVLDGYHRITQAIVNGEDEILAFVKREKYEDGGLIAPNGKPSKLTPKQYKLVRTPQFKEWFGDWENDPQNASKVVDENGEPLVVYHGGGDLYYFDAEKIGKTTDKGWYGYGFYFSPSKEISDLYGSSKSYFLNIKNIFNCNKNNPFYGQPKEVTQYYIDEGYDGSSRTYDYESRNQNEYCVFYKFPNNIKLADGSNTTFDANNSDIRFEDGGLLKSLSMGMGNLKKNGIVLKDEKTIVIAYNSGNERIEPSLYNKALIYKSIKPIKSASNIIEKLDLQQYERFDEDKINEYKKGHLIILNQNEVIYDSENEEIMCHNCKWHWNTNDSKKFDKYVCHKCGFDNKEYYMKKSFKDGGEVVSHASGKVGGVLVGRRHSQGGIKAVNKSNNQPIEMEGGEVVITRNAVSDNQKREFEGEMLTNKEILSRINESGGGVAFASGGKVKDCGCSGKKYKYGGRMMTDFDIVESIQGASQLPMNLNRRTLDMSGVQYANLKPSEAVKKLFGQVKFEDGGVLEQVGDSIQLINKRLPSLKGFLKLERWVESPYDDDLSRYVPIKQLKNIVYAKGGSIDLGTITNAQAYKTYLFDNFAIKFRDLPAKIQNALLMGEQKLIDNYINA